MTHRLEPDAERPTALLKERIRGVFRHLPKALAGQEEPIHQMRVAARRLRVALPLLVRKPKGKRVRRAQRLLRDMTRAGGGSRDLDVGAALFEERLKAGVPLPKEAVELRRRLRGARRRSRTRMAEALLDLDIARLRRYLQAVRARGGDGIFGVLTRVRAMAEIERQALVATLEALADRFDPAELHQARIHARRLRYVAEVLAAVRGQESEAPGLMKQIQERVGHLHDAHVLANWLGAQAERAEANGNAALGVEARGHEAFFREEAVRHHREFLGLDPVGLVNRAVAAMAPARPAA